MMRAFLVAALLPVLAHGGAEAPTQEPTGPNSVQPGQWELVTEMTSIEAPGLSEEAVQEMRGRLASQRQVGSQCYTPEQARNPTHNLTGSGNPSRCEFSEALWAGGIFRIRAACQPPGSGRMRMSITGSYTAQRFDGRIDMSVDMPDSAEAGSPQPIHLQGAVTGRRTGDCATPDPRANDNSLAPMD